MSATREIRETIRRLVRQLVEGYQPERIVLFGSLAYGEPHEDSDIDVLIIKETTQTPLERRVHVRRLVHDPQRRTPFSPLVLTPGELGERLALGDPFYEEILGRGKVLYARS